MSSLATGPTVARRRLRTALRAAREHAGRTQEQAAELLDWSLSKLIRIEAGTVGVSTTDLRAMLQLYEVSDAAEVTQLVSLARTARQRDWLRPYREHIPPGYAAYIGLEREASALYFFQPLIIPGILQTEAYSDQVIRNTAPGELPEEVREMRNKVRLERQVNLLNQPESPRIHAILDESLLHRIAGTIQVMREQLLHLVALGSSAQITLQILAFSAGVNTVSGPFIILEFPDGADNDAVYFESAVSTSQVLDRIDGVAPYRHAFERLSEVAMPPADSLAFIAKIAGELH